MEVRLIELSAADYAVLDAVREKRLRIAQVRLRGTVERYPEVSEAQVKPLTDAEVIRVALARESAFQGQVEKDLNK